MNRDIETMLTASEGRYPTRAEQAILRGWAIRLDVRLAAIEDLKDHEDEIVRATMNDVLKAYPDLEKRMPTARETGIRDIKLVLRYCAQALIRDDIAYLDDSLLIWMATILRGLGLSPAFIRDTYETLGKHVKRSLQESHAKLLLPMIERCINVLSGQDTPDGQVAS